MSGMRMIDLGRPLFIGMPQSPNHPPFWHTMPRRHGDMVRSDGGSAANDMIMMGTHVGTHIDALSHVSHCGALHGGIDATEAQLGGRFDELSVYDIAPIVTRGILLDIPAVLGVERCAPALEVTPQHLDAALARQSTNPAPGDAILVRSGWGQLWADGAAYIGRDTGVPGVSEAGARWLADFAPVVVGADAIAFERIAPQVGHATLPAHRVLLVEAGIPIIETLDLEALADAGVHEFTFVAIPLPLVGATGSPIRPIALTPADG